MTTLHILPAAFFDLTASETLKTEWRPCTRRELVILRTLTEGASKIRLYEDVGIWLVDPPLRLAQQRTHKKVSAE